MRILVSVLLLCFVVAINGAPRIIGGSTAPKGKYPYQVSIQTYGQHICGGSILDERWILTAAHCVIGKEPIDLEVLAGTNRISSEKPYLYQPEYITWNKNYSSDKLVNDIALIRVARDIKFIKEIQPVRLPTEDISKADTPVVLTGWGSTWLNGPASLLLQEINLKVFNQEACNEIWGEYYPITNSHICTYTKSGEGACHGDSGGPLVAGDVQVGIVSFGSPCARGAPDVFTRVYTYLDWIKEEKSKFY